MYIELQRQLCCWDRLQKQAVVSVLAQSAQIEACLTSALALGKWGKSNLREVEAS